MDDLAATLRPLPAQMARNTEAIERLTEEVREMRADMRSMRADMRSMRADISAMRRQLTHMGWGFGAALVALLITQIIALM